MTPAGENQVELVDLNGDGLPDRVQAADRNTSWKVQFNTGSGFTSLIDFGPILRSTDHWAQDFPRYITSARETQVDLMDLNGDGPPDRIQASDRNTAWRVQFNTWAGFTSLQDLGPIERSTDHWAQDFPRYVSSAGETQVDLVDMDGDGLGDRVQASDSNTVWKVQWNEGPFPDLLSQIDNGRGGQTRISYTPSTRFDNTDASGRQRLPFPVHCVTQVTQEDGLGNSVATGYAYKGGMFDAAAREFRGFREVTVTDAVGTKTIHTFGQDDHNKGRMLTKEVRDAGGNLFAKEMTTWSDTHPWGDTVDVHFVHVAAQENFLYDGDSTFKQTRQTFTYDGYGNLASTTEEGDVGVTGDERRTVNGYVYNPAATIVNTLSKTTLYGSDLATVKAERYFTYDGATSITTPPVQGLLTREEEWLSAGCPSPGAGCAGN